MRFERTDHTEDYRITIVFELNKPLESDFCFGVCLPKFDKCLGLGFAVKNYPDSNKQACYCLTPDTIRITNPGMSSQIPITSSPNNCVSIIKGFIREGQDFSDSRLPLIKRNLGVAMDSPFPLYFGSRPKHIAEKEQAFMCPLIDYEISKCCEILFKYADIISMIRNKIEESVGIKVAVIGPSSISDVFGQDKNVTIAQTLDMSSHIQYRPQSDDLNYVQKTICSWGEFARLMVKTLRFYNEVVINDPKFAFEFFFVTLIHGMILSEIEVLERIIRRAKRDVDVVFSDLQKKLTGYTGSLFYAPLDTENTCFSSVSLLVGQDQINVYHILTFDLNEFLEILNQSFIEAVSRVSRVIGNFTLSTAD